MGHGGARPGAGRKKGAILKPRLELEALLRERFGDKYDPVSEIAQEAEDMKGDPDKQEARVKALAVVAKYVRPQLRAIDHTTNGESLNQQPITADELKMMAAFMHQHQDKQAEQDADSLH